MPEGSIARKVEDLLRQSVALESFWNRPVTREALERELARIERDTLMPERLAELYAALGNDRLLLLECLARPSLVERRVRSLYAFDARIHRARREVAFEPRMYRSAVWTGTEMIV